MNGSFQQFRIFSCLVRILLIVEILILLELYYQGVSCQCSHSFLFTRNFFKSKKTCHNLFYINLQSRNELTF